MATPSFPNFFLQLLLILASRTCNNILIEKYWFTSISVLVTLGEFSQEPVQEAI